MPNVDNIIGPISLISHGRSGTSLCMQILRAHPDVTICGETTDMLFGAFHAMERAENLLRPDPQLGPTVAHKARCGKAVRAMFLATLSSDTPQWMHKPINLPFVFPILPQKQNFGEKAEWYWNALRTTFPQSRNITVLRHPYDVVLSSAEYWKITHAQAWDGVVKMARLINHPGSNIRFAVSHTRLVETPQTEVSVLLQHLGLSQHPNCLKAVDQVYVPKPKAHKVTRAEAPEQVARGFSRRDAWSQLDMSSFAPGDRKALVAMWARFGETLEF